MPSLFALSLCLLLDAAAQDPSKSGWPHNTERAPDATDAEEAPADALLVLNGGPADGPALPRFLAWEQAGQRRIRAAWPDGHPEPNYRFAAEIFSELAPLVAERPGVIRPEILGRTVQSHPIWAFRVSRPGDEIRHKILVFGGIHAMEWISSEVATSFLVRTALSPPRGVEVVVVPLLNLDGRYRVERDFKQPEPRPYRRSNARGVDLNRDYEINRASDAVWKHIFPGFYHTTPGPLSQPESRAMDKLASEGFDVSVSLHAFGGYVYSPWAGRYDPPPDRAAFAELGDVLVSGMPTSPYHAKQLSHWAFFFRALGTELDHMYGKYGTYSFLIELSRSGIKPLDHKTWKNYFRWYNPEDPKKTIDQGVGALRALVGYASWEGLPPRATPPSLD